MWEEWDINEINVTKGNLTGEIGEIGQSQTLTQTYFAEFPIVQEGFGSPLWRNEVNKYI